MLRRFQVAGADAMAWQYTKGLHDIGNGCYAWLQPDGGWGFSNSGLIVDGGETLLVDTLMDLAHTREMLDGYRAAVPAAARIGTLVSTHSNGDHTYGNQLLAGARMIASRACAEEMAQRPPEERAAMMRNWRDYGEAGAAWHDLYDGIFDFEGLVYTPPTEVFDDELTVRVGAKEVRLTMVGPAHTRGDVLVHLPADRTVFTGDILFIGGTPVVWVGPLDNWIAACDLICASDVDHIVPGHGPLTDKAGVTAIRDYLTFVQSEATERYNGGMDAWDAARDIALNGFEKWGEFGRLAVNVDTVYRTLSPAHKSPDVVEQFRRMFALELKH
jgi:glyoxylase-like metal-dependent hydrolase (beta-lactamase superfamily II)